MEPAIVDHGGVIDKYVGDAVMALFPNRADDAIRAALGMFQKIEELNKERAAIGEPPVHIGIAACTPES